MSAARAHRGTIFVEDAELTGVETWPGDQFVQRFHAPRCAARALPGSFAHVTCDESLPMRRPLSIMRADAEAGWIELLYKTVGEGLHALGEKRPGERVSIMGPIGQPFRPDPARPRALLVGGGVGIPPMIFLAEHLEEHSAGGWRPLVLMGSEIPFPFERRASALPVEGMPAAASSAMTLLEDWGVASRLASLSDYEGCYKGFVTELARDWLAAQPAESLAETMMFACGPTPMLEAAARVAQAFGIPCQVSLEEFMACAVGGCAGCTVLVETEAGPAMKRVCVDGPVFDAEAVFPPVVT